jgi:hypothetical protein
MIQPPSFFYILLDFSLKKCLCVKISVPDYRIYLFLDLPIPLVTDTYSDPEPSIMKQKY